MILVGIGSNLAGAGYESPLQTVVAALDELPKIGIDVLRRSQWYLSEPVPVSDQPWFVNGVIAASTEFEPEPLLERLLALETRFGRVRSEVNAARTLDLDLLDYHGLLCATRRLVLPHPRLHERRFVLAPLCEIAPQWRHPRLDSTAEELLACLPAGQATRVYRET